MTKAINGVQFGKNGCQTFQSNNKELKQEPLDVLLLYQR